MNRQTLNIPIVNPPMQEQVAVEKSFFERYKYHIIGGAILLIIVIMFYIYFFKPKKQEEPTETHNPPPRRAPRPPPIETAPEPAPKKEQKEEINADTKEIYNALKEKMEDDFSEEEGEIADAKGRI